MTFDNMDWDDAKALDALATGGSMLAAGRVLGVSHATIGRRIAQLEHVLGARLVNRLPSGATLTPLGLQLAREASRMREAADAMRRQAKGASGALSGRVTVAAPPGLAVDVIVPACHVIAAHHPGIDIHVRGGMPRLSLDRLEADLAVRMVRPAGASHARRRLGALTYGFYVHRNLRDAMEVRWVGYSHLFADLPERRATEEEAGAQGIAFEFDDITGQVAAIRSGLGKGLLPDYVAAGFDDLVRLDGRSEPLVREIWLAQHLDLRKSPAVRAVADAIVAEFARDARFRR